MSGVWATQTSRKIPAFRPISLVDSPAKYLLKTPISRPPIPGKYSRLGSTSAICLPSLVTRIFDPKATFSIEPFDVFSTPPVEDRYVNV
ncbi:unannotated protein [freshwater metagenome]|uniref:Unannotated protein n=1 Tax=freshwater metagenome TaxID=449393 RepID=A0A6J7ECX9_9ZZZZ